MVTIVSGFPDPSDVSPLPVILDTDPGLGAPGADIDDGFAILYALASPEIDLLGLSIVNGNSALEIGCQSASALLSRVGDDSTPIYAGAEHPLVRNMDEVRALFTHLIPDAGKTFALPSSRELSGMEASDWIIRQLTERPHEISIAAIGPMTNLAKALIEEPSIAGLVREFVLMAGSATTLAQNVTTVADFNSFVDPEALQIVLESGAPIRMIGLDQTYRIRLSRNDALRLRNTGSELGVWLAECTEQWIDFNAQAYPNRPDHREHTFMHDPLTLAAITHPHLFQWEQANVQVETKPGLTYGMVVANRGLSVTPMGVPNAWVAVDTDVIEFQRVFMDRLMSLVGH